MEKIICVLRHCRKNKVGRKNLKTEDITHTKKVQVRH